MKFLVYIFGGAIYFLVMLYFMLTTSGTTTLFLILLLMTPVWPVALGAIGILFFVWVAVFALLLVGSFLLGLGS